MNVDNSVSIATCCCLDVGIAENGIAMARDEYFRL
jgi:hypothetical protein